jgi:DNA-binding MarR family transcriptional regulator
MDHATDALAADLRILRSLRAILRRVETSSADLERRCGVTQPQLLCLRAVVAAGATTQVEVARELHLSASTLVGVIDRLEGKGLVRRTRDDGDRRRIVLQATAAGRQVAATAPEPLHQQVQQALAGLPGDELDAIAGSVERLADLIGAVPGEVAPILTSGPIPKPPDLEGRGA